MSNNVVPEKLINFRAYNDGNDLLGVTDVQLPSLDAMTETCLLYTSPSPRDS